MKNKEVLLERINNIQIEEKIDLTEFGHRYLKDVCFTQERLTSLDYETRGKYSWIAHERTQSWRNIYPMKNLTYVAFFKTLKGTKRNFIKNHLKEDNK